MGLDQILVEIQDAWGDDRVAAFDAWGSTVLEEQLNKKTSEEIEDLITNKLVPPWHGTPFEGIWFRIYIKLPIFIERQYDKYRMSIQDQDIEVEWMRGTMGRDLISQNELSGRYRSIPAEYYDLPRDVREIAEKASPPDVLGWHGYEEFYSDLMNDQAYFYNKYLEVFKKARDEGRITANEFKRWREVHRGVLGTGFFTYMRLRANLVALLHMWNQRLKPDAQLEAQEIAKKTLQGVYRYGNIPITMKAIVKKFGWEKFLEQDEL